MFLKNLTCEIIHVTEGNTRNITRKQFAAFIVLLPCQLRHACHEKIIALFCKL